MGTRGYSSTPTGEGLLAEMPVRTQLAAERTSEYDDRRAHLRYNPYTQAV